MTEIKAEMAGTVLKVLINNGDSVNEGQEIIIIESMKMEIPIEASDSGKVVDVKVSEGDFVNDGDILAVIE